MQVFVHAEAVPAHQNLLYYTREEAVHCRRGDIQYACCPTCGFVSNIAFDPTRLQYSARYENAQGHSPAFRAYMESIAVMLRDHYALNGKHVIEIGSGNGEFLRLLCDLTGACGVGFDPAYIDAPGMPENLTFVRDFYTEQYVDQYPAALIYARHTIEHIPDVAAFAQTVRRATADGTPVFFETPTVLWILENIAFWDIAYEHCSFFTPGSIARLFAATGFDVTRVTPAFGGQYLWLEAVAGQGSIAPGLVLDTADDVMRGTDHFSRHYAEKQAGIRAVIKQGFRPAIWGAGSKGVNLVNLLKLSTDVIPFVVDINPRKQGKYIAGMGQQIVAPDFLKRYSPDTILVMNPNYMDEIGALCREIGLTAALITI
jgi:hypothetical protein